MLKITRSGAHYRITISGWALSVQPSAGTLILAVDDAGKFGILPSESGHGPMRLRITTADGPCFFSTWLCSNCSSASIHESSWVGLNTEIPTLASFLLHVLAEILPALSKYRRSFCIVAHVPFHPTRSILFRFSHDNLFENLISGTSSPLTRPNHSDPFQIDCADQIPSFF